MLTAARRGDPLDPAALFADLTDAPALCLAVSGGPDSVALLGLACRWRDALGAGPRLDVATVDHGLRPAAAAEAMAVSRLAARFGLSHAILVWEGAKPLTGTQAAARSARYRLLGAHCRAIGTPILVTAHHGDDQAETVLMRLGRGSGVAGLAAMRRRTVLADGTQLVRPLLGTSKSELLAYCGREALPFFDDPSNENPMFHRVRLRRSADEAAALGLSAVTLRRLAKRMARADEAIEAEVARRWDVLAPSVGPNGADVDLALARDAAPEILGRLVERCLAGVTDARPSLERLERLVDALRAPLLSGRAYRSTLGGACLLLDSAGRLAIVPEAPRRRGRARPD